MKKHWTKAEKSILISLRKSGMSVDEIAKKLGRTHDSVHMQLRMMRKRSAVVPQSSYLRYDAPLRVEGDALILSDVEAPFQHGEFINRCLDLAFVWGIDTLIFAGDLLHYDSLSQWGAEWTWDKQKIVREIMAEIDNLRSSDDKARLREKLLSLNDGDLSRELSEARKVFRSFNSFNRIFVAVGNHDDRFLRSIQKNLSVSELLHQLDRHNDERWHIAPYYYCLLETEAGTYRVTHPRNSGRTAAQDLAAQYHQHIIMGHSHRWSVNRDPSARYWAIQTGHCVDEERLAYVMQRDAKRDAHMLGATIVRGGYPFVLCPQSPWEMLKKA